MKLVTQPPRDPVPPVAGAADKALTVPKKGHGPSSDDESSCYLPSYFDRHAAELTRNRDDVEDEDAMQLSYVSPVCVCVVSACSAGANGTAWSGVLK